MNNSSKNTKMVNSKTEEFVNHLARCDTQSFIGVCKILNIRIDNGAKTKEEFDLRSFEEIWAEVIEKFNNLGRAQRRELNKVIRLAVSADGNGKA